jgi:uracil phosphoribosyltransferase
LSGHCPPTPLCAALSSAPFHPSNTITLPSLLTQVQISNHPVLAHKLSILRSSETSPAEFRRTLREITFYLGYEATTELSTKTVGISTPLADTTGAKVAEKIALIPIMRAGLGMLDAMLELTPNADVHHIGMYRVKETLLPIQYYNKLPKKCEVDVAYILDPMIATAGTLNAVITQLKKWGCPKIHVVAVLASKTGLATLVKNHPDITINVSAVDEILDERGYIMPGLGDAGNRLYQNQDEDNEVHNEKLLSPSKRKRSIDQTSEN